MPSKARTAALARKLSALALAPETRVPDLDRVRAILDAISTTQPVATQRTLLKTLLGNLARETAQGELRIEYAGTAPSPETVADLITHFSNSANRPLRPVLSENPALLAGLRVRLADNLLEASLQARLARLT